MVQEKRKKKKRGGASQNRRDTMPDVTCQLPSGDNQRFHLGQKSKTLDNIAIWRKPEDPAEEEPPPFERKPSSFRKRINTFLQNSPFLKRASFLKQSGLKNDISRLSDSLESLKIDENSVSILDSKSVRALDDNRRLCLRKGKSKSFDQFRLPSMGLGDLLKSSPTGVEKCQETSRSTDAFGQGNIDITGPGPTLDVVLRVSSVKSQTRPRSWMGLSIVPKHIRQKPAKEQTAICAAVAEDRTESCSLDVRSRSLTHIDQIEQGKSESFLTDMSCDKGAEQLLVPTERSKSCRPMLSRSEASSSECFTVSFEGLPEDAVDEFVPASQTTMLGDALQELCKRKGVEIENSNVFLDHNKSPLPSLELDTSWMAGKHIRIKVNDRVTAVRKDAKNSFGTTMPLKKISTNYRSNKSGSRTHNVSSEEPSLAEPGTSSKSAKRWSGFFGTSRDTSKMETLVDLLDSYTKNGVYEYEDIYKLESDWKSIVANAGNLEDRHSQQQEAIWELLRSEIDYINMLRVVSHLFIACLVNLQSNQLLLEIDNKKLFGNVEEVFSCNDAFWKKHLMPVVEASRKTNEPLNPEHLRDGFLNFASFFKCYEAYCSQQSKCQHYCREKLQQDQDNELFTAYLAWCETQKECNRLKLMDILVKPMQRLTKYSLLLKAILKHTSNASHRDSLITMIRNVDMFVNQVNSTLKQNQDLETMKQLMGKIESYDVIDTKDDDLSHLIQKYSTLNLTYDIPGTNHKRGLLFESDIKYKDAMTSSKIEVHAFLFTDMLLVTKPVKRLGESKVKFKVIRQPFVIDRLVTQEIARDPPTLACVYLSVYQTACFAFVLSCSEVDLIRNWSDSIKKAKALYASIKSNSGVQPLQPPMTLPISRQQSGLAEEDAAVGDAAEENKGMNSNLGLWAGRSPRGSSRGSRVSSLVHSHSGSMEMTENISSMSSMSASRGVSVENNSELRGSSLSSDDGNVNQAPSPRLELTTSPRTEKRDTSPYTERRDSPVSPRPESKSLYRKTNNESENTLTIQVPHLGQSLPNLNIASSACANNQNPSPPNTLLLVPPKSHGGLLSPSQRGVSYPPPSPPRGSLKRGFAISPRNPPLMKTGHVSVELTRSLSAAQPPADVGQMEEKSSKTIGLQTNLGDVSVQTVSSQADSKCEQCTRSCRGTMAKANGKKLMRSERKFPNAWTTDNRKTKKEGSIYKRPLFSSGPEENEPKLDSDRINKHISLAGVHSSSDTTRSLGSNVQGLHVKDEGSSGASSKGFRFYEILHLISQEGEEEEARSRLESAEKNPQSDLEHFESKVSKWQKYGYREEEVEYRDINRLNLGLNTKYPHNSDVIEGNDATTGVSGSQSSRSECTKSSDPVDIRETTSLSISALQLEVMRPPFSKMPKSPHSKSNLVNHLV